MRTVLIPSSKAAVESILWFFDGGSGVAVARANGEFLETGLLRIGDRGLSASSASFLPIRRTCAVVGGLAGLPVVFGMLRSDLPTKIRKIAFFRAVEVIFCCRLEVMIMVSWSTPCIFFLGRSRSWSIWCLRDQFGTYFLRYRRGLRRSSLIGWFEVDDVVVA